MARCRSELKTAALLFATSLIFHGTARAQTASATPVSLSTPQPRKQQRRANNEPSSPEVENIRKALEALTPEQRKEFRQNFIRWSNLPPEEKKALRDQSDTRRKQMADEIGAALQESGLQLDPQRQKAFARRYTQERRRVEEQVRQEMDQKRSMLIAEFLAKLKAEFSTPAGTP